LRLPRRRCLASQGAGEPCRRQAEDGDPSALKIGGEGRGQLQRQLMHGPAHEADGRACLQQEYMGLHGRASVIGRVCNAATTSVGRRCGVAAGKPDAGMAAALRDLARIFLVRQRIGSIRPGLPQFGQHPCAAAA
jgi:hypothetical protein